MVAWSEPPPRAAPTLTWTGSGQVNEKTEAAMSKWVTRKGGGGIWSRCVASPGAWRLLRSFCGGDQLDISYGLRGPFPSLGPSSLGPLLVCLRAHTRREEADLGVCLCLFSDPPFRLLRLPLLISFPLCCHVLHEASLAAQFPHIPLVAFLVLSLYMCHPSLWCCLYFLASLVAVVPFLLVLQSCSCFFVRYPFPSRVFLGCHVFPFFEGLSGTRGRFLAPWASSMSFLCHPSHSLLFLVIPTSPPPSSSSSSPVWAWSQSPMLVAQP